MEKQLCASNINKTCSCGNSGVCNNGKDIRAEEEDYSTGDWIYISNKE